MSIIYLLFFVFVRNQHDQLGAVIVKYWHNLQTSS